MVGWIKAWSRVLAAAGGQQREAAGGSSRREPAAVAHAARLDWSSAVFVVSPLAMAGPLELDSTRLSATPYVVQ